MGTIHIKLQIIIKSLRGLCSRVVLTGHEHPCKTVSGRTAAVKCKTIYYIEIRKRFSDVVIYTTRVLRFRRKI